MYNEIIYYLDRPYCLPLLKIKWLNLKIITEQTTINNLLENIELMAILKNYFANKLSKEINFDINISDYELYHKKNITFILYNKWNDINNEIYSSIKTILEFMELNDKVKKRKIVNL
jgi:hypothetical protein